MTNGVLCLVFAVWLHKWSEITPINGLGLFHPYKIYKCSYFTLLLSGDWAHLLLAPAIRSDLCQVASGTFKVPFSAGIPAALRRWSTNKETRVPSCTLPDKALLGLACSMLGESCKNIPSTGGLMVIFIPWYFLRKKKCQKKQIQGYHRFWVDNGISGYRFWANKKSAVSIQRSPLCDDGKQTWETHPGEKWLRCCNFITKKDFWKLIWTGNLHDFGFWRR